MKVVDIERVVILMRFIQYGWDEERKKSFDDNLRMMLETQCEDLSEHDKQIIEEVNKETNLKIIHTRRVLHDIQRMDMPKDVYERLNYELDKILYDWSEQLKGE